MSLFYIKPSNSTFVLRDEQIFTRNFETISFSLKNTPLSKYLYSMVKLFFTLLFSLNKYDVIFIRFADYHTVLLSLFSKLFNKKLIIVVGGFDGNMLKEYNYGAYVKKLRGWATKYSLKNADLVLPNTDALIENENNFAFDYKIGGGIKKFVPSFKGKIKTIHNGFDPDLWFPLDKKKEPIAISVAIVKNYRTFKIKGVDLYLNAVKNLSDLKFIIVGISQELIEQYWGTVPENLVVIPFANSRELRSLYQKCKVLCLFSLTEGMSNVLCESMLCECIPVGSNVGGTPEIIDNWGFVVKSKNTIELSANIQKAMQADESLGKKARQRIIENYSLKKREKQLIEEINHLLDN